jgi:hypothetical protein
MRVRQRAAVDVVFLVTTVCLTATATPALATQAEVPSWKDQRVHGFVGCLTQEAPSPQFFDLVNARSDEGEDVGTLRLTGHFLGIGDPNESLHKRCT